MMDKVKLSMGEISPHLRNINLYQCKPDFKSGDRRLYSYYFLYVHKGKGVYRVGDEWYPAVTGDLFFCPPGMPNAIFTDENDPFLLTGIDFEFTQDFCFKELFYPIQAELFEGTHITQLVDFVNFKGFPNKIDLKDDHRIRSKIYEMINDFKEQKTYWNKSVDGILQSFIILVAQRVSQMHFGIKNIKKSDEIIRFLTENYMQPISNDQIAHEFHYHPDYINKIVFAYTGITLKQHIIDLRMRAAMDLLLHSDLCLEDIAVTIGYVNPTYFYRIFKKKIGVSPGSFRKNSR